MNHDGTRMELANENAPGSLLPSYEDTKPPNGSYVPPQMPGPAATSAYVPPSAGQLLQQQQFQVFFVTFLGSSRFLISADAYS